MRESITLTLAGKDYIIRPLNIRQLRAVTESVMLSRQDTTKTVAEQAVESIDTNSAIIKAAFSRDFPDLDVEAEFEGSPAELDAMAVEVLILSGMVTRAAAGEAKAEAASAA